MNTLSHLNFFSHNITQKTIGGKNTNKKKMSTSDLIDNFSEDILLGKSKDRVIVACLTN